MNIFKDYFNISTIISFLLGLAIVVLSFLSNKKPELDYINLLMRIAGVLTIINSYGDGISQLKNKRKIYLFGYSRAGVLFPQCQLGNILKKK